MRRRKTMLHNLILKVKGSSNYKWWVILCVEIGTLVTVADIGEVNVAMPTIADRFSTDLSTVQWLATGYLLATSTLLMPMGRLSDIMGRKRIYVWGLLIFTLGALLACTASNLQALILFRMFQGMGIGMVHGNQMAIISSIFPSEERGKALGIHMTMVGIALIIGPAVGGVLVDSLGWRSVFYINVPLGLLCAVAPMLVMEDGKISKGNNIHENEAFDWLGGVLSSIVLVTLVIGLTNPLGWTWAYTVILLTICGVSMAGFLYWETKTPNPMLNLKLFQQRIFLLGVSARTISFLAAASIIFLMPFYLQGVVGYSPGRTGIIMTSIAFGMVVVGPIAGRLSDRYGPRPFTVIGALLSVIGLLVLSRITIESSLSVILIGICLQSCGGGMFMAPNASAILSGVPRQSYGVVSGFIQLVRTASTVLGIAITTIIIVMTMSSLGFEANLAGFSDGAERNIASAFTQGFKKVFIAMAAVQSVAVILSLVAGRPVNDGVSK